MIVRLFILSIALLQAGCSTHLRRAEPPATADDVAVYAVVLDSVFARSFSRNKQIVVLDSTEVLRRENLEDWLWGASADLVALRKDAGRWHIVRIRNLWVA